MHTLFHLQYTSRYFTLFIHLPSSVFHIVFSRCFSFSPAFQFCTIFSSRRRHSYCDPGGGAPPLPPVTRRPAPPRAPDLSPSAARLDYFLRVSVCLSSLPLSIYLSLVSLSISPCRHIHRVMGRTCMRFTFRLPALRLIDR